MPPVPALHTPAFPLSYQQQSWLRAEQARRVGYEHRIAGPTTANVHAALWFVGEFHRDALQAGLEEIVRRHEILRCRFRDGAWVSTDETTAIVNIVDLEGSTNPAEATNHAGTEAILSGFDYAHGPFLIAWVLKRSARDHVIILLTPHLVSDAISIGVVVQECIALYARFAARVSPTLDAVPAQYSEFVDWQRSMIAAERPESIRRYCLAKLAGATPLTLPTDYGVPDRSTATRGEQVTVGVAADIVAAVRATAKQHATTPFVVFLAAFKMLLARWADREDILIVAPVSGRPPAFASGVIGLFAERSRFRTRLDRNPTFADVVQRVRHSVTDALRFQYFPYAVVDDVARACGTTLGTPAVAINSATVEDRPSPVSEQLLGGKCAISPYRVVMDTRIAQRRTWCDVSLWLRNSVTGIDLSFVYRADLFAHATIQELSSHFLAVLPSLCANPSVTLGDSALRVRRVALPR